MRHPYDREDVCRDGETSSDDQTATICASGYYAQCSSPDALLMARNDSLAASPQHLPASPADSAPMDSDVDASMDQLSDSIDNPSPPSSPSNDEDEIDKDVERCILRILQSKVKYGWSQEEALTQLQSLYELINENDIPHKSWGAVISFLKRLGYKDPRHYKVCCGKDHVVLVEDDECPNCQTPKEHCIDYFVLGLNLESAFLNENLVKCHLAHWEEKDDWFNVGHITVPYKEIWHGSRFRELSYFWDEQKYKSFSSHFLGYNLPCICS